MVRDRERKGEGEAGRESRQASERGGERGKGGRVGRELIYGLCSRGYAILGIKSSKREDRQL